MLASIALITIAAWVMRVQRHKGLFCLIPALLLWVTVTLAMVWYLFIAVPVFRQKDPVQAYAIGAMIVLMLLLNLLLIYDFITSKGQCR